MLVWACLKLHAQGDFSNSTFLTHISPRHNAHGRIFSDGTGLQHGDAVSVITS